MKDETKIPTITEVVEQLRAEGKLDEEKWERFKGKYYRLMGAVILGSLLLYVLMPRDGWIVFCLMVLALIFVIKNFREERRFIQLFYMCDNEVEGVVDWVDWDSGSKGILKGSPNGGLMVNLFLMIISLYYYFFREIKCEIKYSFFTYSSKQVTSNFSCPKYCAEQEVVDKGNVQILYYSKDENLNIPSLKELENNYQFKKES